VSSRETERRKMSLPMDPSFSEKEQSLNEREASSSPTLTLTPPPPPLPFTTSQEQETKSQLVMVSSFDESIEREKHPHLPHSLMTQTKRRRHLR
jgi:hypothetical protein